jgi:hypothetical protein
MKWFLIFWAGPIFFLGSWYWLSYYDMSMGVFMYTRQMHDLVFQIYGNILGIPPETIPPLVMRAIAFDTLLVFSLIAYRKRAIIKARWTARQTSKSGLSRLARDESLSRAP